MAAGVPVVASNICGIPYMIKDGKNGYLVDPSDPDKISDRIISILKDEEQARLMGEAAQREARSRFHIDMVTDKTIAVYSTLRNSTVLIS